MTESELAQWQSILKIGEPKHILAEREWQRRMISHQLTAQYELDAKLAAANERAMRFAAIIGVMGTLAGAGLGAFATFKTSVSQTSPQSSPLKVPAAPETSKELTTPAKAPASAGSK